MLSMFDDLFTPEDISKPENRINLAIFSLMQQDRVREALLEKLGLCPDAIVYPSKGARDLRPDFKVLRGCSTLAWIEVELGKDEQQAECYYDAFPEPVKTIWGRKTDGGDLSLEEIADYLDEQTDFPPQVTVNVRHLTELIRVGLANHSRSRGRANVSDEMWNHPLMLGLRERLGDRLKRTTGKVPEGYLKTDTTATKNSQGFSLRVNANESNIGSLSLMNVTAGRSQVQFPSLAKLRKYLPEHHVEVGAYSSALVDLGLDIGRYGEQQRGSLPLNAVLGGLDELTLCLLALAAPPSGTDATVYERREVGGWTVPTIEFISPARRPLGLQVAGEIVNEFTGSTSKKKDWKWRLTSEVKLQRGDEPWKSDADYAISLSLRFHPGYHGGSHSEPGCGKLHQAYHRRYCRRALL